MLTVSRPAYRAGAWSMGPRNMTGRSGSYGIKNAQSNPNGAHPAEG